MLYTTFYLSTATASLSTTISLQDTGAGCYRNLECMKQFGPKSYCNFKSGGLGTCVREVTNGPPIVSACPRDARSCPDGSWVGRDPATNCATFKPCPQPETCRGQTFGTCSQPGYSCQWTPSGGQWGYSCLGWGSGGRRLEGESDDPRRRITYCNTDWDCLADVPDGATIEWDFPGKCLHNQCVPFSASDWDEPAPSPPRGCTYELKTCPDGVTQVGRDSFNNCEFEPCPELDTCGGMTFGTCSKPGYSCQWTPSGGQWGYSCLGWGSGGRRLEGESDEPRRRIKHTMVQKGSGVSCWTDWYCNNFKSWLGLDQGETYKCMDFEGKQQCTYTTIKTTGLPTKPPGTGQMGDRCTKHSDCAWGLECGGIVCMPGSLRFEPRGRRLDEIKAAQAPEPELEN